MTQYVLEILDGDRAGEVVALTEERVTIGRKPTNTLALKDEKASGNHAEVVFEDGRYVLRDLGSTNGTLLDGKRVEEVALSAQDVFQIGRVRVLFRSAEAASGLGSTAGGGGGVAADDLQVHKVDMARLARSGKRRSVAGLSLLLLGLAGGAGYLWYSQNLAPSATNKTEKGPQRDPQNLLKAGDDSCEVDTGWDLRVTGAAFGLSGNARTGQSGLEASYTKPDAAGKAETCAVARLKEALNVLPGESLELVGYVRTTGAGKGAVRARFVSGDAEDPTTIVTGVALASAATWTEQKVALAVPAALGKVQIELVAVLPGEGSSVAFDDLVLKKGGGSKALELTHPKGAVLLGTGVAAALRAAGKPAILAMRAATESGETAGLSAKGMLGLSDLPGAQLGATLTDKGFAVQASGGTASALVLEIPADVAAAGVLARQGDTPFVAQNGAFTGATCSEVLFGAAGRRLLLKLPQGIKVSGHTQAGSYLLDLAPVGPFEIVTVFEQERQAARDALDLARSLERQGKTKEALEQLRQLVERTPHDEVRASEAVLLRNKMVGQLGEALAQIDAARKKAEFLGARRALQRTRDELANLVATYGEENFADKDQLQKVRTQLEEALAAETKRDAEEHKQNLQSLQDVLKRSGMESLAGSVEDYIKRRFQ